MKALVMSGGGVKGAYQVGVLKYLLGDLRIRYDVICGVSVGALNTAFLGMFRLGLERECSDSLLELWNGIDTSKIYKRWFPFGRLHSLWNSSMYDSKPLQELVNSRLDMEKVRASGKILRVGAVALESGQYRTFSESDDEFVKGVLASSAFPSMLCPIEIDGETWVDGGVKEITPLKTAIDLGASSIDVIMCAPETSTIPYNSKSNAIRLAERSIDLMTDEILANDVDLAKITNEMVLVGARPNKRLLDIRTFRPDSTLVRDSLNFEPDEIRRMIERGYSDAVRLRSVS